MIVLGLDGKTHLRKAALTVTGRVRKSGAPLFCKLPRALTRGASTRLRAGDMPGPDGQFDHHALRRAPIIPVQARFPR